MTHAPASFAALANYSEVDVGGYGWTTRRYSDGAVELSPFGERRLPGVSIVERPGDGNDAPTYYATVRAADIFDLTARQDGFVSAEAAVAWAIGFEFASRQVGSLTWRASASDDHQWYAVIGTSVAGIFKHDPQYGGTYTVTRRMLLGRQSVEFKITDSSYRDDTKGIVSFEQASAIALTMSDYVMELMRTA